MRICIETMAQIALLGISCLILVEIIMVNIYIQEGRNYLHQSVDLIECSDNREDTAALCAEKAKEKGYSLTWEAVGGIPEEQYLLLTLEYELSFGEETMYKGTVQAYAR